ncbi:hypothetical protein DL546_001573 [Coniochaeta pulveracea]|uniref:Uncharacterized protein n=1 Tax=Coniochaeta pulveracea TaxID=177199 RepID=A0A420YB19_9PEZI|nr:hypothetical protein DL546_001573 [Coniochaeta pulveracea]
MKPHLRILTASTLLARALASKSDCQCIAGFDPNAMPKMNVTDFFAESYANGTSILLAQRTAGLLRRHASRGP